MIVDNYFCSKLSLLENKQNKKHWSCENEKAEEAAIKDRLFLLFYEMFISRNMQKYM